VLPLHLYLLEVVMMRMDCEGLGKHYRCVLSDGHDKHQVSKMSASLTIVHIHDIHINIPVYDLYILKHWFTCDSQ
jgi:hypothetical protein